MSLYEILKEAERNDENKLKVFSEFIAHKTVKNRILYSAILELTPICNFNCHVCYIRMSEEEVKNSGKKIMRFDQWKYYIDGLCDLGLSSFTLTGGECTLHPDFAKIYEYIYDKGKQIVMITNGSAITDNIINLLVKKPPSKLCITLYGASEKTYEKFCKNGAAYHKVFENIEKLTSKKIYPIFNYTCSQYNIDDLEKVVAYAKKKHLQIRPSWELISYNKCTDEIISKYQVDEKQYSQVADKIWGVDKSTDSDIENIENFNFSKVLDDSKIITKGISCDAARNHCSINWEGKMKSCVALDVFTVDSHKVGGVKEAWHKLVEWADNVPLLVECQKCIFRKRCSSCIAKHYNDTHQFGKPSPRLCFKVLHPEEAAKMQAEYDRQQAEKSEETNI
ncbi:MAG: radical SAM protein [Ruminococcus sp.]|nr:radical SAM protein [Ruminococcus sp.]